MILTSLHFKTWVWNYWQLASFPLAYHVSKKIHFMELLKLSILLLHSKEGEYNNSCSFKKSCYPLTISTLFHIQNVIQRQPENISHYPGSYESFPRVASHICSQAQNFQAFFVSALAITSEGQDAKRLPAIRKIQNASFGTVFNWMSPPVCFGLVWHCCFMIGLRISHQETFTCNKLRSQHQKPFLLCCQSLWQLVINPHLLCFQHGWDRKNPDRCFICAFEASNTS